MIRKLFIKIGLLVLLLAFGQLVAPGLRGQTTVGPTPGSVLANPSTYLVPPMISNTATWSSATIANSVVSLNVVGFGTATVAIATTTPISTGAVTFEATESLCPGGAGGLNCGTVQWYPIAAAQAHSFNVASSYTLTPSTNQSFGIGVAGYVGVRVRLSTAITGAGTATVTVLANAQALDTGVTSEKGNRWQVVSNPAAGTQATASRAAGTGGTRHVADCVSFSAGSTTAPVLTALTVNLRDGATGAGTILWTQQVVIPAGTGQNVAPFSVCGLALTGSQNTAMTLEFSALLANLIQSVSISGYDIAQ